MNAQRPARIFYGYYVVGACFVVLYMVWGMVLNTFPVFLKPIADDMGWGRGALSVALLMGSIASAVVAPIAGVLIDRIGARPVMTAGSLMIGIGCLASSRATELWHLYVMFALIGCGLMCSSVIPCSLIVSNWFVSRRGAALSAAFVGTSVGGMVMSPVANWVILHYGWRAAFAWSGAAILVVVIPVILLVIRTRPSEMGLEPYREENAGAAPAAEGDGVGVREAFGLRAFWQIAAIMLILGVVPSGLGNHCVAYLTDLNHSPSSAAFAWSVVMGVMVLGKLSFGPLADRWGASRAMGVACVLFAVSILILTFAQPYWVALAFASTYGFACGAPLVLNALLTGTYLGMRHFAALYGVLNLVATVGAAVGPVATGIYFDREGTYLPVFYAFGALMLLGSLVAMSMSAATREAAAAPEGGPAELAR